MIATVTANPCIDYNLQVDELVRNETVRSSGALFFPGGTGVNAARAITRLGEVPVTAYGFTGGQVGEMIKSLLDGESVAHDFIDTGLNSRINVLVSLKPDRSLVRVNTPGPDCTEDHGKALIKQLLAIEPSPKYIVLGGSLPGLQNPAPLRREYYARLIDEFKKKPDVKFILDSRDLELGHGVDKGPFVVKPNAAEMSRLSGRKVLETDKDFVAAAEDLIGRYDVGYFVISLGARGCIVVGKNERYKVTSAEAVSSTRVAAGDAFVGGLVWALAKDKPIDEAARYAVAVGTATVLSPATAMFRTETVDELLPKVSVEAL